MEEKDIMAVKTTRGELRYYRDWDNYDGGIVMLNAQTIDRYKAIKDESVGGSMQADRYAFYPRAFGDRVFYPQIGCNDDFDS